MAASNLGKDPRTGDDVFLSIKERLKGLYCLGTTGTGKTTFLVNLALQDIRTGRGLCCIDPHGDAIKDILSRLPPDREKDVILLNPQITATPFGLNLFSCPDSSSDEQVALTVDRVMHVFDRVWNVGTETPRLAYFLRNITITLIENNLTMAEIPLLLQDSNLRAGIVRNVKNSKVRLFWQTYNNLKTFEQEVRNESTLNKVDAFLTQALIENILGQSKDTIDWRFVMDEGKIVLVELSPRIEGVATLLGSVIVGKILDAAYSRTDIPSHERKLFALYVDEFQRYATDDMATLLAEARKFGIATTIAHQVRKGQLSEKLEGATLNASNFVIFKIASIDADIASVFDTTPAIEVTGSEETRVPRKSVVTHLMISGHESPKVMKFTREYIIPLNYATKERVIHSEYEDTIFPSSPVPGALHFVPEEVAEGMVYLNEYLYLCMTHGPQIERDKLRKKVERLFSQYLGFVLYLNVEGEPGDRRLSRWLNDPQRPKQKANYEAFHKALIETATELEASAIMEGSGQYKDIKRQVQTYADRQHGIANTLTHLARFIAWAKLGNNKYELQMRPLPPRNKVKLSDLFSSIRRRNVADGYLRPVSEVRAEIRARHDDNDPPLTSKQRV